MISCVPTRALLLALLTLPSACLVLACRDDAPATPLAPGDGAAFPVSFGIVFPGTYRMQAVHEATTGRSPVAELPLVVLAP